LFNSETKEGAINIAGTINKFKITTVVVSLTTFVVATLLVLLADKIPHIKRSSEYRKWKGKMQARKKEEKKEELSDMEEQDDEQGEKQSHGRLRGLVNRVRKTKSKKNENPS
jgi:predicted Holliday junction resolvase-like endonuclease